MHWLRSLVRLMRDAAGVARHMIGWINPRLVIQSGSA
jgi:hypothetical protein